MCAEEDNKIPMRAYEYKAASSSNPVTWSTYEQAVYAVENGIYDYLGFVFHNNGIVGIDIDVGFEDGLMTPLCADIVGRCQSYTEKSKSGRGVHIFLRGSLPFEGKNNRQGVEIYQTGRFFITTGKKLLYGDIIENQEAIDYVVDKYFQEEESQSNGKYGPRIYSPSWGKPTGGKFSLRPKYPRVGKGGRNISMTSLAGQLHTAGYGKEEILAELRIANAQACDPPLTERELKSICNSVTRYRR